jgi:hypothetical protein
MIAVMQRIPLVRTLLPVVTMAAMIKTEFFGLQNKWAL